MTVPNVLATRYASPELREIWSPAHKIVLERRLWIAVLTAQRDLGVHVPDGVIEAYEQVVDKVDKTKYQVALTPVFAEFEKQFGKANLDKIREFK